MQQVKDSGVVSEWMEISKGVPQGSVLGPTIFNIFINDFLLSIKDCLVTNYADDNTLSYASKSLDDLLSVFKRESLEAIRWFEHNFMSANPDKFQFLVVCSNSEDNHTLTIDTYNIVSEDSVKLLGVEFDKQLNFNTHVSSLIKKAARQLHVLKRMSSCLSESVKMDIFRCFILSHFNYCSPIWHYCGESNAAKLEKLQHRALKFVFNDYSLSYEQCLERAKIPCLKLGREQYILTEIYKALNGFSPEYMSEIFTVKQVGYNLRNSFILDIPRFQTVKYGKNSVRYAGAALWNQLPNHIKNSNSLKEFKEKIKNWNGVECRCSQCK